jgi:hypothetical protein
VVKVKKQEGIHISHNPLFWQQISSKDGPICEPRLRLGLTDETTDRWADEIGKTTLHRVPRLDAAPLTALAQANHPPNI